MTPDRIDTQPAEAVAWQPMSTAPRDGTGVLALWVHDGDAVSAQNYAVCAFEGGCWRSVDDLDVPFTAPTHWMPLPSAPGAHPAPASASEPDTPTYLANALEATERRIAERKTRFGASASVAGAGEAQEPSITSEQRDRILQNLRGIYNAKIAKWSKLDDERAEDLKAEAFGAEFVLIGILERMVKAGNNTLSEADQRRNACPRGYNRCGWDAKADACVAEGCALAARPVAEATSELKRLRDEFARADTEHKMSPAGSGAFQRREAAWSAFSTAIDRLARQAPAPLSQAVTEGTTTGVEGVFLAANDYADQRVMATKGRAGPVEVSAAADHLREVITAFGQLMGQRAGDRMRASAGVPAGFWLAPMDSDEAMEQAGFSCLCYGMPQHSDIERAWLRMRDSWLSRRPQPQAVTEDARDGEQT